MTPERGQKTKTVLEELLEISREEQTAFLDRVCANDAEMRKETESLLTFERCILLDERQCCSAANPVLRYSSRVCSALPELTRNLKQRFRSDVTWRRTSSHQFGVLVIKCCSTMPFKSKAQRRKFARLLVEGKISDQTFEEWNRETGNKRLPERVRSSSSRKKAGTRGAARKTQKQRPASINQR
ncbi:MAG: hypothetical protein DMG90_04230 [Acidobacteria bacterium]|jgi:hypothetical protein|nr:MAG: hypothetical protein DMG91_13860 [Acidobacteriota bacterium]PYV92587.1 MAG: hypothetical protein DMG90_04230 [Acidobacteriota bacterium]